MKKITIYILSILIGLFCLGGGTFLFTSDMSRAPSQEDVAEPQYTLTFKRGYDSYFSGTMYVANCTTNANYTLSRPSSSSATTSVSISYSASDTLHITIARMNSYNYNFITDAFVGGASGTSFTFVNEIYFEGSNATSYSSCLFYSTGKYTNYRITYDANGGTFAYGGDAGSANGNNKWYSNSQILTLGGRTYHKKSAGTAFVGYAHRQRRWTWPVLVATSSSYVRYYTSYNTSGYINYGGSFVYNNTTYYYSGAGEEMQNCYDEYSSRTIPYADTVEWLYAANSYGSSFNLQKLIAQKMIENVDIAVIWSESGTYTLPAATPYREGYTFKGWYTSSSGGTQVTTSTSASTNKTVYAQWTENTYYLEFIHPEDGQSYSTSLTVKHFSSVTFPAGYCDPGYHLDYWEDDWYSFWWTPSSTYAAADLVADLSMSNGSWVTFYGVDEVNTYYLEFYDDSGGSDGPVDSASAYYTGSYTMPSESDIGNRWGYHLQGWWTDGGYYAYTGDEISISDIVSYESLEYDNEAYISLYTDWQEDETSSVTVSKETGISSASFSASYDGVSGYLTGQTSNTGVYDGSSVTYTASVSSGYTFDGWYNGTTKVSTNTSYTTTVYNNTTLTAKATAVPAIVYMKLALAGGATWPSGVSASARLNYTNTSGTSTYTTVSASVAIVANVLSTKSVTVSNISFSDTKLAYVDYWVNTTGYNTNHSTGYHPSTSGFTVASSASGTYYVTLVFTYCNNSALLKYDSTNKYFYFEDGQYPQTYAGSSMNSTLNSWYTSNSPAYSMYINGKSVSVYNYSGTKYARIQAPKASTVSISTGSTTFSSGTYYWFRLDPIRWRVSNYGVGSTAYPTMVKNRGVVASNQKVVSDLVLDWAPIYTSTTAEGWTYKDSSTIHSQIYSTNNTNLTNQSAFAYKGTGTYSFDAYSNTGTTVKVTSSTSSMSGILQVSTQEISLNTSDIRAKASDLVCMLAGVSSGYCDYWTRDLTTLNNGLYVTSTGITRNRWLTSACGVRLAYTLSSVARTRD